ncbi:MAG: subclass B3 metallo-beta-lactamase [Pseudomonadota bacterium]
MKYIALGLLLVIAGLATLVTCSPAFNARAYSALQGDNKPMAPFSIADGLHYIGASNVASYAIETQDGLIVIDGGYAETVPIILENLATLGFKPSDVSLILNTQSHMDHAAGLAPLKAATGARLAALPASSEELARGGRDDFFLGNYMAYAPIQADIILKDAEPFEWGGKTLTPLNTAGHTRGCTSWVFEAEIEGAPHQALLICSLAILRYKLVDNEKWPGIANAFQATFDLLENTPCDVFLEVHGFNFDLEEKRAALADNPTAFVDPEGCRRYISYNRLQFENRLAAQSD